MPILSPKVSVIIASYSPGDAVNRVIESLDAQTLPAEEFEVIFVDDGSPDDTVARLQSFAATRPNMQVHRIENTGWPSRPRNVGIEHAQGEYVMFMDHDDSLFPDGLRRAYEYAHQNDADLLSPKESKTNDSWWGMSSLTAGNIPDVLTEERIHRVMPFVPHKLYRRQLILDHNIRFPEGARVLWEDWYINLDVYRHARTVSILADTPVYLWHASDGNSSHTFHPSRVDFWDRLDQMMAHIVATLDTEEYRADRNAMLAHNLRTRVIDRCVRLMATTEGKYNDRDIKSMAIARSRRLLEQYLDDDTAALVPKKHRIQAHLIAHGDPGLVASFHSTDKSLGARMRVDDIAWIDGVLRFEASARWAASNPAKPGFRWESGRLMMPADPTVAAVVPPELFDLTEDIERIEFPMLARARFDNVSWQLSTDTSVAVERSLTGQPAPTVRAMGWIDPKTAALGAPLNETVWDVRSQTGFAGMVRLGGLGYPGKPLPALNAGRPAVAYASKAGALTLDNGQVLRTFVSDAKPAAGPAGSVSRFRARLELPVVHGAGGFTADTVFAVDESKLPDGVTGDARTAAVAELAQRGVLHARVVAEGSTAWLEGGARLGRGSYRLYAHREGALHRTPVTMTVDRKSQLTID